MLLFDAVVITVILFVVHDNPPSYEYAILFAPPTPSASRIIPPPTAIRKLREYTCDHVVPSAPFADRTTTEVVSVPPLGRSPCVRPTPPLHIAPVPAPAPVLVCIPVVSSEIEIFTYATALVHKVGLKIAFVLLFHCDDAVISVVLAIRDPPAPDVAIHEYPVQAIPFNRPNVVFERLKLPDGFFHSVDPFTVLVNAI
jgi:hypothetical protein